MNSDINGVGNSPDEMPDTMPSDEPIETPEELLEHADLELITEYLTGRLPAEQVADVKRRLDEDEAFREFAAPLIVAWSVPPRWQRHPMPRAEIEKQWDRFTKRVGFVHQRRKSRKRRRRWVIGAAVVLLSPFVLVGLFLGVFIFQGFWAAVRTSPLQPRLADAIWATVPLTDNAVSGADGGGWIPVSNARVRLDPGAKLFRATAPQYRNLVKLEGSARFLRVPAGEAPAFSDSAIFAVFTEAGLVASTKADFRVSARGDTTDVEVLRRGADTRENDQANAPKDLPKVPPKDPGSKADPAPQVPDHVVITSGPGGRLGTLFLREGEIGRLQPRSRPVKLRAVPADPIDNNPVLKKLLEGFLSQ